MWLLFFFGYGFDVVKSDTYGNPLKPKAIVDIVLTHSWHLLLVFLR